MSSRPGRPRDPEVHEAILTAAAKMLGESGYARLSIDGVAQRAGVARKSIYRRWPDKLTLVTDLLQHVSDAAPHPNTGSLRGDLLAFYQLNAKGVVTAGGPIVRSLVAESLHDPELATIIDAYFRRRRTEAKKMVERAVARGEIKSIRDSDLFFDMVAGFFWYRRLIRRRPIRNEQATEFVDIFLKGLPTKL